MTVEGYRDLIVWQKAMRLVVDCYRITRSFPDRERYGLTGQLQRAAVSVPANIAEGYGRGTTKAYLNHLWIANGSLAELETHLLIARELEYGAANDVEQLLRQCEEVGRILVGLRRSLDDAR